MFPESPHKEIIFIADPRILSIPTVENHESLIDLTQQTTLIYGPSPEIPNNTDYTQLRESVYNKLIQAEMLLPSGWKFCLYEGYRSLSLQKMLFENRYALVHQLHPNWTHEQLFVETTRIVSPVINIDGTANIPPHSTGGAIDIYLLNEKRNIVDMGMHPKDWMLDVDGSLSVTNSLKISEEARYHRQLMGKILANVGFVNYPTEFWHWSYGDRYWAYHTKHPHAIYGSC